MPEISEVQAIDMRHHPFRVNAMGGYSYFSTIEAAAYVGWQRHAEVVNIARGEVFPYPHPKLEEFFPHLFAKPLRKGRLVSCQHSTQSTL